MSPVSVRTVRTEDHMWKNRSDLAAERAVCPRLTHMDAETHRRRGGWGWSPCSARMTQSGCCLSACSRSPEDSVTLTSSDSQPELYLPARLVLKGSRFFSPPLVCLLLTPGDSSFFCSANWDFWELLCSTLQTKYYRLTRKVTYVGFVFLNRDSALMSLPYVTYK